MLPVLPIAVAGLLYWMFSDDEKPESKKEAPKAEASSPVVHSTSPAEVASEPKADSKPE